MSAKRILVVDDEPDVLLLCKVNLEFEGYDVIQAANGSDALELVTGSMPDLVLLDVMMPEMDGWQVLEAIKSNPATNMIPVVMLTAKAQERDQIRGWNGGVADYVTKPFNPIALSRTIQKALEPATPEEADQRRKQMLDKLNLVER